jgi:hypothetical protein
MKDTISEMESLLRKKVQQGKLSNEDRLRALELTNEPDFTGGRCMICNKRSIYDTCLCQKHALAIISR